MPRLRLAFLGAPEFALPTLGALIDAGHEIAAVYSQPPCPAGRGQRERPTPVAAFAAERGLLVRTPASLKPPDEQDSFRMLALDAAVVVAYGLLLPLAVLEAPRLGCLNVHPSLLPRWRGAAPIQRAILEGDVETGVTIMLMDEGLDSGPILARRKTPITATETGASLHDRLAAEGARLLVEALGDWAATRIVPRPQPSAGVTYARKLSRAESRLDWRQPAERLERQVRAFFPWPGSFFELQGQRVRVLSARLGEGRGEAGSVLTRPGRLVVACGQGSLDILELQREGRAALPAADFLRGFPIPAGTVLP
ncbi:MAG TPA: methionyl-tRNA formyltransferase [Kiloniellales bacterium]|nr:methionyl-tRNA formyltransferase [Kiloniellales bacterium]